MKITIEGADKEFAEKLVVLAAQHQAELTVTTVDTTWTVERAMQYLSDLPANAFLFAQLVVDEEDGTLSAESLREQFNDKLRGPTIALSRAVTRGVRKGWWPNGTAAPVTPKYDPNHPSWMKVIAYTMTSENVPIFRAAFARIMNPTSHEQEVKP